MYKSRQHTFSNTLLHHQKPPPQSLFFTLFPSHQKIFLFKMIFIAFVLIWNLVNSAPLSETRKCWSPEHQIDFIVVGGGSSGSVVASRLAEVPSAHVLLLEAGSEPPKVADIPLRARDVIFDTAANWNYITEPQTNCCKPYINQVLNLPSGKGLGGTSNINSMIYTRGNQYDYDRLQELGISGWSYRDVLPIFKKMENYQVLHRRSDRPYHGFDGIQTVSTPQYASEMADAFLQAGDELKYFSVDVNSQSQLGFTAPPVNIKDGTRWGSYHAYLDHARNKLNLHIVTEAFVTKVLFDDNKHAIGVTYMIQNTQCTAYATKEIIISAGALRSPQLLMNSGIGPRDDLEQFQIPIVKELPGVGKNLKDHVLVSGINFYLGVAESINFTRLNTTENIDLWHKSRIGPMTSPNGVEGISFFRSTQYDVTDNKDHPTFEISFYSDQSASDAMFTDDYKNTFIIESGKDAVTFLPILLQPLSIGDVRLRSNNPMDYPKIDPKYLSNPLDQHLLLEVLKLSLSIGRSKAFKKFDAELIKFGSIPGCNDFEPETDEFWLCYIRRFAVACYHFVGTCKMAAENDSRGVVDSELKVFGVSGLRVADASVLPELPAAHLHAIALLIGERAAEFIKKDYSLDNLN